MEDKTEEIQDGKRHLSTPHLITSHQYTHYSRQQHLCACTTLRLVPYIEHNTALHYSAGHFSTNASVQSQLDHESMIIIEGNFSEDLSIPKWHRCHLERKKIVRVRSWILQINLSSSTWDTATQFPCMWEKIIRWKTQFVEMPRWSRLKLFHCRHEANIQSRHHRRMLPRHDKKRLYSTLHNYICIELQTRLYLRAHNLRLLFRINRSHSWPHCLT